MKPDQAKAQANCYRALANPCRLLARDTTKAEIVRTLIGAAVQDDALSDKACVQADRPKAESASSIARGRINAPQPFSW